MPPNNNHQTKRNANFNCPRVAYLSTYPPRECGIATFCEDLVTSTMPDDYASEPLVIAMENRSSRHRYSWPVCLSVQDSDEAAYENAAHFINDSTAELVSVQHEFGIYGGLDGAGISRFLSKVERPVVTTLHTVLPQPDKDIRERVRELANHSHRLVVMNALAEDILHRDYGIERNKVALIHHGTLPPSLETREEAKERLGMQGRKVMTTFGLVARGKGLEYAIEAMPSILEKHPDFCYLVVGQTHPGVQRHEKESYREILTSLVERLGLQDSVKFINRYVSKSEIMRYLAASDIYITPYLNPQQITSGTLAYALAAGRCIVSTPYLHAKFLLAEGRGMLVDFRSAQSIANTIKRILDKPRLREALERKARIYGQRMYWPVVGLQYARLFKLITEEARPRLRPIQAQLQLSLIKPTDLRSENEIRQGRPATVLRPSTASDRLLWNRPTR